ncbi:hypothetical protein Bca101_063397 [Brassica carinata]
MVLDRSFHKVWSNSAPSHERRSALDRLSIPVERIPLLQDGVANAESGRLQEVEIQMLDDIVSPNFPGGTNIPSGSRNPNQTVEEQYDPNQVRSPIRSLSEDRLHVSLRLGPLYPVTEVDADVQEIGRSAKAPKANNTKQNDSRKRTERSDKANQSPAQGVLVKRRRVTKGQSSPKRRTLLDPKKNTAGASTSSRGRYCIL